MVKIIEDGRDESMLILDHIISVLPKDLELHYVNESRESYWEIRTKGHFYNRNRPRVYMYNQFMKVLVVSSIKDIKLATRLKTEILPKFRFITFDVLLLNFLSDEIWVI